MAVAYSGGRDSTGLVHAALVAARDLGVDVVALHVNHRLSAHADQWEQHCRDQCARWADDGLPISFDVARLSGPPQRGDSIEAWARRERYAALKRLAQRHAADLVLLAHHRGDQAETLILQALRSAGVAGLSGMPRSIERDGLRWARPWLDKPRSAIETYVQAQGLAYIDDDSNTDERYARNRLRHRVWPALERAFPDAELALAAAATWAQQASACLDEVAADDLLAITSSSGLSLPGLQALSVARRINVLRAWLRRQTGTAPPASLITRLSNELMGDGSASWPLAGGSLRRYRGHLTWQGPRLTAPAALPPESTLRICRAGTYRLPGWGGHLRAVRVKEGGVPLAWLAHIELRERSGGERFQAGIGRPARSLKKQFQAAELPAWQRAGPLVYSGGQLIFVPGLGIDARVIGLPGQPQVTLHWESHGQE
ncbi:MAG: tRNA lysidine(34) synthetase TilS [Burkholderiales bacterium PBB1]|nr:MAG: tRNA lysidine(34) synthetase TilS [Burkholderiales bacterium PBB1]